MANLSLGSESAAWNSQASSRNGAQSPFSRPSPPQPKAGDTATIVAFNNARDTYRKSLSEKDFNRIMLPTAPEDVVNDVEKWHKRHLDSKFAASVRSGLGQLQRFSASIDMLAQGTPSPGCLLWGSIKFVLTIVQDAVQAYEQLCKALVRMIDCLPRIEIYIETFLESSLVADCVNAFYVSAIRFWARACKYYRRRRLWRVLRAIWNDFDAEFGDLEADMIRNRDKVEGAALAEHVGESKKAKVNQESANSELLETQFSTRQKELTAWLAPVAYDVEYFSNDFVGAKALCHPKTCSWVLKKHEMMQLCDTNRRSEESLLWIYANPGAGKTLLSSFLIDHFQSKESDPDGGNVFYFFCKNTDTDKNTPTSVVRSLLFQLHKSIKDQKARQAMVNDLGLALDKSGQRRAVNFTVLWQLFSDHVISLIHATIVLDALDECQDPKKLIEGLKELSRLKHIKVIMTSRKELHLHSELSNASSIEISPEDIHADIAAFVEAKVEASAQLSHPLVRDLVITKLCNAHDGMFLWVYLVLKELKSCISLAQVRDALKNLPTGLDGIYKSIVQRLETTLTRSCLDLCSKVLTWVVSAVRPLRINEIKQALILHYEMDGDTLLTDDRSFPYSDKDVELICGSLVTIRKETLQVIHLTVKEFLRSPENTRRSASPSLLVNPEHGSLQLTLVCLRCIADFAEPLTDLKCKAPKIDWYLDSDALQRSRTRAPLLEYASFSWLAHIIDCRLEDLLKITPTFRKTFNSSVSFSWVELCMASQPDSTLRLLVGFDEVSDKFCNRNQDLPLQQDDSSQFLASWCTAFSRIFEEYGAIFARRPWEIYLIDLYNIFEVEPGLESLWQRYGETSLRARNVRLNGYRASRPPQEVPQPHLQLQKSLQLRYSNLTSVFLVYDERRNIYIWGETEITDNKCRIFVQHSKTGQRLPPAEDFSEESGQTWLLIDHGISPDGRHLVLFYQSSVFTESYLPKDFSTLTILWRLHEKISFEKRMNREPWARVIFSETFKPVPSMHRFRAVVFEDDHHCLTPIGTIDLLTGNRRPLPDGVLNYIEGAASSFFGCSGRYLFASPQDCLIQTQRFDLHELNKSVDFYWADKRRGTVDVSPTGRYLVLGPPKDGIAFECEEEMLYLYDTDSSLTVQLPFPQPLNYSEGKFHFSRHETRLTTFLFSDHELIIVIWDCLTTVPRLINYAKWDVGSFIQPRQVHISETATLAIMVTRSRSIQRIKLGDSIELLDAGKQVGELPYRLSAISRDCSHWASVSYGPKGGKVQIIDLTSPDTLARHFDLEWSQRDISEAFTQSTHPPIGISPDLHVLVINAEVFDLTTNNETRTPERSTLNPFTIEAAPALLKPHRNRYQHWGLECRISACNSYVIYVNEGDQWGNRSRYSSAILLYRIDLKNRTSSQLELMLPDGLVSLFASFHPSLPLMAVSYGPPTSTELDPFRLEVPLPPLHLAICDINTLVMTSLELPEGQYADAMANRWSSDGWLPRLLFSNCGTFAYLEDRNYRKDFLFQKVHQIDIDPVPFRYVDGSRSGSWSSDNSLIHFHDGNNTSVALELVKFVEAGFWRDTRPAVQLKNIASYSSRYAAADRHLLLGANDDEKMRLLIAPHGDGTPVIQPLSLTFAEARSRLLRE